MQRYEHEQFQITAADVMCAWLVAIAMIGALLWVTHLLELLARG